MLKKNTKLYKQRKMKTNPPTWHHYRCTWQTGAYSTRKTRLSSGKTLHLEKVSTGCPPNCSNPHVSSNKQGANTVAKRKQTFHPTPSALWTTHMQVPRGLAYPAKDRICTHFVYKRRAMNKTAADIPRSSLH